MITFKKYINECSNFSYDEYEFNQICEELDYALTEAAKRLNEDSYYMYGYTCNDVFDSYLLTEGNLWNKAMELKDKAVKGIKKTFGYETDSDAKLYDKAVKRYIDNIKTSLEGLKMPEDKIKKCLDYITTHTYLKDINTDELNKEVGSSIEKLTNSLQAIYKDATQEEFKSQDVGLFLKELQILQKTTGMSGGAGNIGKILNGTVKSLKNVFIVSKEKNFDVVDVLHTVNLMIQKMMEVREKHQIDMSPESELIKIAKTVCKKLGKDTSKKFIQFVMKEPTSIKMVDIFNIMTNNPSIFTSSNKYYSFADEIIEKVANLGKDSTILYDYLDKVAPFKTKGSESFSVDQNKRDVKNAKDRNNRFMKGIHDVEAGRTSKVPKVNKKDK